MTREVVGHGQSSLERRRFGWGAALGFVLVMAGIMLLLMVFMIVVLGPSWLPVGKAEALALPTMMGRTRPPLAPAPSRATIDLPTPLPGDIFPSAVEIPQSGFGPSNLEPLTLLPESPADIDRSSQRGSPAGSDQADGLAADDSTRLLIPAIGVDAPIKPVGLMEMEENGRSYQQWQVPSGYAIGWHSTSAWLGLPGNTVLNGHNNVHGAVFRDLVDVNFGDEIVVHEGQQTYRYQVAHREVLEESDQPLSVRLENAKWMFPTSDERLTLISCWPYVGNTHRVIVVATPVEAG
ncbi:MAG TPA: sortase [Anaerolineae bacterium]|jgi:sortase A|nr:sortase [Anaerolineae bacterium]